MSRSGKSSSRKQVLSKPFPFKKRASEEDFHKLRLVCETLSENLGVRKICPRQICRRHGRCSVEENPALFPEPTASYLALGMPLCMALSWKHIRHHVQDAIREKLGLG